VDKIKGAYHKLGKILGDGRCLWATDYWDAGTPTITSRLVGKAEIEAGAVDLALAAFDDLMTIWARYYNSDEEPYDPLPDTLKLRAEIAALAPHEAADSVGGEKG